MKIYTRRGDAGETGLFGGGRVPKDDLRVEAYGTVDELNSVLGLAVAHTTAQDIRDRITLVQHDLFSIGSHLATPSAGGPDHPKHLPPFPSSRIVEMEDWIDAVDEEVPPLRQFLLPGGSVGGAYLHHGRTVCRRAERRLISLARSETVNPDAIPYLNRLSDLLFALARLENLRAGGADVLWEKPQEDS